jgi:acyl-[acyl-carrier-protein] desaturase
MIFYRNLVTAAFDIDPDETMKAVANEVMNFEMPGANMANFRKNSTIIAKAGIYDLRLHHDEVVSPILRTWKVFDRSDLGPEGEQAREQLAVFLAGLDAQATRFVESRERLRARMAAKGETPVQVP